MKKLILKKGDVFHYLTAVKPDENRYAEKKRKRRYWFFKCACGSVKSIAVDGVTSGNTKSCCKASRRNDLTGKQFGFLTVICYEKNDKKIRGSSWKCKCVCGKEDVYKNEYLRKRANASCGCKFIPALLPNDLSNKRRAYRSHKSGARKRNIKSDLSFDEWLSIALKPCSYCRDMSMRTRASGENNEPRGHYPLNSVDRLNNEPYYTLENAVPACFKCQRSKRDMTHQQFVNLCLSVSDFQDENQAITGFSCRQVGLADAREGGSIQTLKPKIK